MNAFLLLSLFCLPSWATDEKDYYLLDHLTPPEGEILEIGGIDFLSDGRLVCSTRRGEVWVVDNPRAENPNCLLYTSPSPRDS